MADKLKCPFCGAELFGITARPVCINQKCEMFCVQSDRIIWEEIIQAKNDLAAARAEIAFNKEHYDFWDRIKTNAIQVYEEHYSSAIKALKDICNIAEDVEAYYGGVSVNYHEMAEDMKNRARTALEKLNHDYSEKTNNQENKE